MCSAHCLSCLVVLFSGRAYFGERGELVAMGINRRLRHNKHHKTAAESANERSVVDIDIMFCVIGSSGLVRGALGDSSSFAFVIKRHAIRQNETCVSVHIDTLVAIQHLVGHSPLLKERCKRGTTSPESAGQLRQKVRLFLHQTRSTIADVHQTCEKNAWRNS